MLNLPPLPRNGPLDLWFEADGSVPHRLRTTPDALPETVVLSAGLTLTGRVVRGDDTGISGARVDYESWLSGDASGELLRRTTIGDDEGNWRLAGVAGDAFAIRIEAPGFAPSTWTYDAADEATSPLRFVLSPRSTRTVEVYDEAGAPVSGAGVSGTGGVTARSDERGSAVLGVAEDRALTLQVDAEGHLPSTTEHRPPLAEPLVVTLTRAFRVRGRFVSESGEPVDAGRLVVETATGLRTLDLSGEGAFAADVPPGVEATLHLVADEVAPLSLTLEPGEAGEVRELGDLSAPASLRVRGRVVEAVSGRPLAGATVAVEGAVAADSHLVALGARPPTTRSGEDGRFSLGGLRGESTVWVQMPGRAPASLEARPVPGGKEIDLGDVALSPGATVRVYAPEAAGRAVAKIEIGPGRELSAPVEAGLAVFEYVPDGTFVVAVSTREAETCRRSVEVPATGWVDVACRADTVHVLGVVMVDGRPVGEGHLIWLSERRTARPAVVMHRRSPTGLPQSRGSASGPPQVDVTVEADGSFESTSLRPGRWQVAWLASAGDQGAGPVWVEVPAGEEWRPVLDLSSGDDQPPSTGHHSGG